jgi:hypothetical protein
MRYAPFVKYIPSVAALTIYSTTLLHNYHLRLISMAEMKIATHYARIRALRRRDVGTR